MSRSVDPVNLNQTKQIKRKNTRSGTQFELACLAMDKKVGRICISAGFAECGGYNDVKQV